MLIAILLLFLLFSLPDLSTCTFSIKSMNPFDQIETYDFDLDQTNQHLDYGITYGIMSRYAPLQGISQVGKIGPFDSNCFHYHSAVGKNSNKFNFIYYVCLTFKDGVQEITKFVKFRDNTNLEHIYSSKINNYQYEYVWFYLQIISFPNRREFNIFLIQYSDVIIQSTIQIQYPYFDRQLILAFGGGADGYYDNTLIKYSYFPGEIKLYNLYLDILAYDMDFARLSIDYIKQLNSICQQTQNIITDRNLIGNEIYTFTSQNPNTDSFQLAGWIRIIKIIQDDEAFIYKILKMSSNLLTPQLTDDNLSPFCLFYQISPNGNKLIFTTYSYTFPSVNVDFEQHPFIMTYTIDFLQNIQHWLYLSITLKGDQFQFSVDFSDGQHYEQEITVQHFHLVTFQIQIGNLEANVRNYLNSQISQFHFTNCNQLPFQKDCHFSCQSCDGPTNFDCLTCQPNSGRLYISTLKQCVCPLAEIENNECNSIEDLNLQIILQTKIPAKCQYGYFQVESECFACPIIGENQIYCLECLQNPNTWYRMLYCQQQLISINGQNYQDQNIQIKNYYIFDGENIKQCQHCQSPCLYDECIFSDYLITSTSQVSLAINVHKYDCNISNCVKCDLSQLKEIECIKCNLDYNLISGVCVYYQNVDYQGTCFENCVFCDPLKLECASCFPPYYLTLDKKECKLCSINHCQHCFEFNQKDLNQNTLFENFNKFDDQKQIGCSLCEDGYNFDFTLNKCIYGQSSLQSCLKSFTNQSGEEICMLSSSDFFITPQTTNCKKYIQNCEQCLLLSNKVVKCTLCAKGYVASPNSGLCELCMVHFAITCYQGDFRYRSQQNPLFLSFLILFLQDVYINPLAKIDSKTLRTFASSCEEGYQLTKNGNCSVYCSLDCLECLENDEKFICVKCPLNNFGTSNLSSDNNNCLICPKLCKLCQTRSLEQINQINPFFISNSQNIMYTYTCMQPQVDSNIQIDPELQVAKYCLQNDCRNTFKYEFSLQGENKNIFLESELEFYENKIDTEFCNQMGISEFHLSISLFDDYFKQYSVPIISKLKEKIFTLQLLYIDLVEIKLYGGLKLYNFDSARISLQCFAPQISFFAEQTNCNLMIINNKRPVDFTLLNSVIKAQTFYTTILRMEIDINRNLIIKNVLLQDLYLQHTTWLMYNSNMDESIILIEELTIMNCIFDNVTLFAFQQYSTTITISQLTILNTTIQSSVLIKFLQQTTLREKCKIEQLIIKNCIISSSIFLLNQISRLIQFNDILLINNTFTDFTLIQTELSISLTNLKLINNSFYSSNFIMSTTQSIFSNFTNIDLNVLFLDQNLFKSSTLLNIKQKNQDQNFVNLQLLNFTHISLFGNDLIDSQVYLYQLQCEKISIKDFKIIDSQRLFYFKIQNSEFIELFNVEYRNNQQNYQIQTLSDFIEDDFGILIHIQGLASINFTNILIKNIYISDYSLIEINSDVLYKPQDQERIQIRNVTFIGNELIKTKLGNILSMITIFSELSQIIEISQLFYYENFFHQYVDDPSQNAAGLLFINSLQSVVHIDSLYCNTNGLTNSSYSFMTINALSQSIRDFQNINGNNIQNRIWKKYYDLNYIDVDEDSLNLVIQYIVKISNKGGACKLQSSDISVFNALFQNLLSASSSVFDITTQGAGIIIMMNIKVLNATVKLYDNFQAQGSITIYSLNSLLHATFINIYLENVNNRLNSAIFTITPSINSNYISMNNISMINCFSLINQFMAIKFSEQSEYQNFVLLHNLIVVFREEGWKYFVNQITVPNDNEVAVIQSESNALVYIDGCKASLINITVSGILISPVLQMISFQKLLVINLRLNNLQVMYPLRLMYFYQTKVMFHSLIIENLLAQNISQYSPESFNIPDGSFQVDVTELLVSVSLSGLITQLNRNFEQKGCIIYANGNSGQLLTLSSLRFQSVHFQNNFCNFCYEGLFYLQYGLYERIFINNFVCQSNFILVNGCLMLATKEYLNNMNSSLAMKHMKFIANNGTSGVGLNLKNVKLVIRNSLFLLNSGTDKGGALYTEDITNDFIIEKTYIFNNSAARGGGIYMSGNSRLTNTNFIQSLLAFNTAKLLSNNLVEVPDHLALSINNNEMNFENVILENNQIQVLSLKPYKIIQQGDYKETNILYLSSGTSISYYRYYNTQGENFINYITEFSIIFKNSRNEKIEGYLNDFCTLEQRTQNLKENKQNSIFSVINTIYYLSEQINFPLGEQTIIFDPYQHDNQLLLLQMNCISNQGNQSLYYQFHVKTFFCQLGEFISSEGCRACQSSQGFYSVTYNTTQCSIFDKNKLKDITSNRLNLNSGYWRPTKYSNQVDLCYKNQQYCIGGWGVNDDLCFQGHLGGLCEECDIYNLRGDGNYAKMSNNQCGLCQTSIYAILPFLLVSLWSFITILLTLKSNQSTKQTFARLKATTKLYQIIFKLNQDFESIFLKMFLNNLWIFSIIFTFNINFDFQLDVVEQISNPNASMATNLDCFLNFSSNLQLVYIRIIAMIVFILIQLLLVVLGLMVFSKFKQISFDISVLTNTAIYLYVSNQATLIKNLGSLVAIRTISGEQYVQGDVTLLFFSSNHQKWIYFLVVPGLGIIGVFIPLSLFIILITNRDKFNETNFRKHLGYLFNDYTNRNQFWEQIKIWERSIIIIIMTCFETNIYYKISLLSLTILVYQELMSYRKPYIINSLLKIDNQSGFIILMAMFLAQIKYICEQDNNKIASTLLQFLIVMLCIKLCYSFVIRILQLYFKKYKLKVLFHMQNLTYYYGKSWVGTTYFQRVYKKNVKKSQQLSQNLEILRKCKKIRQTDIPKNKFISESITKRSLFSELFLTQTNQRILNSIA